MKTHKHLYPQITSFDNLYLAFNNNIGFRLLSHDSEEHVTASDGEAVSFVAGDCFGGEHASQ